MKKSKILILGLIALLLVGGLVLASCDARPCARDCSATAKADIFKTLYWEKGKKCAWTSCAVNKEGKPTSKGQVVKCNCEH